MAQAEGDGLTVAGHEILYAFGCESPTVPERASLPVRSFTEDVRRGGIDEAPFALFRDGEAKEKWTVGDFEVEAGESASGRHFDEPRNFSCPGGKAPKTLRRRHFVLRFKTKLSERNLTGGLLDAYLAPSCLDMAKSC